MSSIAERRAGFRRLHEGGCFAIPNPWDVGSAIYLQSLGFSAVATSSAGMGFSQGLPDSGDALSRELVLAHVAQIVAAVDLPVNADFQAGYASDIEGLHESVRLCVETGVAGLSIEDATGDRDRPLYDLGEAVERIAAARAAIDASEADVMLTARAECFLVHHPDALAESVRRLTAYSRAGADVLYAPGLRTREEIMAIVKAAGAKPVNVLVMPDTGLTMSDMAELGVRRVSVGSALARSAWTGFMRAARGIAEDGSFAGLDGLVSFAELNGLFEGRRG